MADNDYSQYEEIELLRLLLQKQDRLIEVEEAVVEGLKAQLASIDESLSTLEVFSTNSQTSLPHGSKQTPHHQIQQHE